MNSFNAPPAPDNSQGERKEEVESLVKQEREYVADMKTLLEKQEQELQSWLENYRGEGGVQLDDAATEEMNTKKEYIEATKGNIEDAQRRLENLGKERLKDIPPA